MRPATSAQLASSVSPTTKHRSLHRSFYVLAHVCAAPEIAGRLSSGPAEVNGGTPRYRSATPRVCRGILSIIGGAPPFAWGLGYRRVLGELHSRSRQGVPTLRPDFNSLNTPSSGGTSPLASREYPPPYVRAQYLYHWRMGLALKRITAAF